METTTPTPWYKSELFRWAAGIALGFLVSWLSSHGITPKPIPELPALVQEVKEVKQELQDIKSQPR